MHATTAHVSALSPATVAWVREVQVERRIMSLVASCVVSGALITIGNFVARFVA